MKEEKVEHNFLDYMYNQEFLFKNGQNSQLYKLNQTDARQPEKGKSRKQNNPNEDEEGSESEVEGEREGEDDGSVKGEEGEGKVGRGGEGSVL